MSVESQTVHCENCGLDLEEASGTPVDERKGCPRCGSMSRHFSLSMSETVTVHGMLGLKGRHATGGRPFIEQKVGDDFHRKSGRWMMLERVIDRATNWYREVVTHYSRALGWVWVRRMVEEEGQSWRKVIWVSIAVRCAEPEPGAHAFIAYAPLQLPGAAQV
jgi:phage FluMu protein Com